MSLSLVFFSFNCYQRNKTFETDFAFTDGEGFTLALNILFLSLCLKRYTMRVAVAFSRQDNSDNNLT